MTNRRVLLVDDEKHILTSLKRLLRKEDYELLTAEGGKQGMDLFAEHDIHLVISDERMPEMSGSDFLKKVKDVSPDTVRVILSGYADVGVIVEAINQREIFRFFCKPWNDDELKASIRQCLNHYDILEQNRELLDKTQRQNRALERLNCSLEQLVSDRTVSLQMSQQILEVLPVAVIGISKECEIILTNEKASELFPSFHYALPGIDMSDLLPDAAIEAVNVVLAGQTLSEPTCFSLDGREVCVQIRVLGKADQVRGCMLLIEEI